MPGSKHDAFNFVYDSDTNAWRPQPYTTPTEGGDSITLATNTTLSILSYSFDSAASLWKPAPFAAAAATGGGASNVKNGPTSLKANTIVSGGAQSVSSVLDTTDLGHVLVTIDHAPLSTSAPAIGTEYKIEIAASASDNAAWRSVVVYRTSTVAAATVVTPVDNPAGTNVILLTATPAYTSTDKVFFSPNAGIANGEWAEVADVVGNTSITLRDPMTSTQASSAMFNKGEQFVAWVDVADVKRLRCTCNNNLNVNSYPLVWRVMAMGGTV